MPAFSQDTETKEKRRWSRINLGLGINIPLKPHATNYNPGMSINESYEFLFLEHFSLIQGLAFNFISGQTVEEFYENQIVNTEYENLYTVPLQFGIGYYFGENQKTFFVLIKGGVAYFKGVNPAYPEIIVNGNVVKPAIAREEYDGVYNFITPTVGWQFERFQIRASYQGHVEQDATVNILNFSVAYKVY